MRKLVLKYDPSALGISDLFALLTPSYLKAEAVIEFIRKNIQTEQINAADRRRDHVFRGFVDAIKSARNHFDETKQAAARDLWVVMEHYGNLNVKSANDASAALYKLLQEMEGKFAPQIAQLGLQDWLPQLEQCNQDYLDRVRLRVLDKSSRPPFNMVTVRRETDRIYRDIILRIEALMVVQNLPVYGEFANELNTYLKERKDIMTQRKAMNVKR